jgi:hypothetical protein
LYRYLGAHPEVFVPSGKELHFFTRYYDKGVEWYSGQFSKARGERHRGEATPVYFCRPEVPGRVAELLPDVLLIVSLRHPVDRLYSTYWTHFERGREKHTFDIAISTELRAGKGLYLDQSKYVDHFERWDVYYSPERFHVLLFDDLVRTPDLVFQRICRHLDIDEIVPPIVGKVVNEYRRIWSSSARKFGKTLPAGLRNLLARVNTRAAGYKPMNNNTRELLLDFFTPYNKRLESRLNTRLPESWSE